MLRRRTGSKKHCRGVVSFVDCLSCGLKDENTVVSTLDAEGNGCSRGTSSGLLHCGGRGGAEVTCGSFSIKIRILYPAQVSASRLSNLETKLSFTEPFRIVTLSEFLSHIHALPSCQDWIRYPASHFAAPLGICFEYSILNLRVLLVDIFNRILSRQMDNTGISQDGVSDESYHIALGTVGDQRSEITH